MRLPLGLSFIKLPLDLLDKIVIGADVEKVCIGLPLIKRPSGLALIKWPGAGLDVNGGRPFQARC